MVYVVRNIDLLYVAYSDDYYKTKSAAVQSIRDYIKSDTYTDIVYAVDIEYSEENIELLREDYSFNEFDYRVVYKRWGNKYAKNI